VVAGDQPAMAEPTTSITGNDQSISVKRPASFSIHRYCEIAK